MRACWEGGIETIHSKRKTRGLGLTTGIDILEVEAGEEDGRTRKGLVRSEVLDLGLIMDAKVEGIILTERLGQKGGRKGGILVRVKSRMWIHHLAAVAIVAVACIIPNCRAIAVSPGAVAPDYCTRNIQFYPPRSVSKVLHCHAKHPYDTNEPWLQERQLLSITLQDRYSGYKNGDPSKSRQPMVQH